MIVKTLFQQGSSFVLGEVEVRLMPGIPLLHVVGQPDAHIRECGIKLKSALKACGLEWPQGNQIVVNLRPSYLRKSSSGADLAMALAFMALTGQLAPRVRAALSGAIVYGEIALNGQVFAPEDLASAVRFAGEKLITGLAGEEIREGRWCALSRLDDLQLQKIERHFAWDSIWQRPEAEGFDLPESAVEDICLAAHMGLNILVAGPQGSGKSSWAKALYALTPKPDLEQTRERLQLFGESALEQNWRPFERPHHSIPPLSMIGGGTPIRPGVISRAHGGVLVMDEFLEFDPRVLEALREPLENGYVEHARAGARSRFPSRFQLIATTNLCPCGKLRPELREDHKCSHSLIRCRSVCMRLSGPIMDRFDLLVFSHAWLGSRQHQVPWSEVLKRVDDLRDFGQKRGEVRATVPPWMRDLALSHRRGHSLLRVARGLADLGRSQKIEDHHFLRAYAKVVNPMLQLNQVFA